MKKLIIFLVCMIIPVASLSEDVYLYFTAYYKTMAESVYPAPNIEMTGDWGTNGNFRYIDAGQYRISIRNDHNVLSVISYDKCDGIEFLSTVCCAMGGFLQTPPDRKFMGNLLDSYLTLGIDRRIPFIYDIYMCAILPVTDNPDGIQFVAALSSEITN